MCSTSNVLQGKSTKCRSCADKIAAQARAKIQAFEASSRFVQEACNVHGNRYDYSLVVYVNNYSPVNIVCPIHGVFSQDPSNHKQGHGCHSCAVTGFNKSKTAILYYLRVQHLGITVYKVGITNLSVRERFNNTYLAKIRVLKVWEYTVGSTAYNREQEILKQYQKFKYVGEPLLSSGNTELFIQDVLNLDTKEK